MGAVVIIVGIACIGFFIWARMDYKKKKARRENRADKPPFRTEDDLNGYEKPLKDKDHSTVDMDDAE